MPPKRKAEVKSTVKTKKKPRISRYLPGYTVTCKGKGPHCKTAIFKIADSNNKEARRTAINAQNQHMSRYHKGEDRNRLLGKIFDKPEGDDSDNEDDENESDNESHSADSSGENNSNEEHESNKEEESDNEESHSEKEEIIKLKTVKKPSTTTKTKTSTKTVVKPSTTLTKTPTKSSVPIKKPTPTKSSHDDSESENITISSEKEDEPTKIKHVKSIITGVKSAKKGAAEIELMKTEESIKDKSSKPTQLARATNDVAKQLDRAKAKKFMIESTDKMANTEIPEKPEKPETRSSVKLATKLSSQKTSSRDDSKRAISEKSGKSISTSKSSKSKSVETEINSESELEEGAIKSKKPRSNKRTINYTTTEIVCTDIADQTHMLEIPIAQNESSLYSALVCAVNEGVRLERHSRQAEQYQLQLRQRMDPKQRERTIQHAATAGLLEHWEVIRFKHQLITRAIEKRNVYYYQNEGQFPEDEQNEHFNSADVDSTETVSGDHLYQKYMRVARKPPTDLIIKIAADHLGTQIIICEQVGESKVADKSIRKNIKVKNKYDPYHELGSIPEGKRLPGVYTQPIRLLLTDEEDEYYDLLFSEPLFD